jgi:hypothetical protein
MRAEEQKRTTGWEGGILNMGYRTKAFLYMLRRPHVTYKIKLKHLNVSHLDIAADLRISVMMGHSN